MNKKAFYFIVVTALSAVTSGCQSTHERQAQEQQLRMKATLAGWVNQPVSNYALNKGNPIETIKLSDTRTAFRWVFTHNSPGAIVPIYGSLVAIPSQKLACSISLIGEPNKKKPELKDFIVVDYSWNGYC